MRLFLPAESSVVKVEFYNGIRDPNYFYLLGTIRVTESQLTTLCRHLESARENQDEDAAVI